MPGHLLMSVALVGIMAIRGLIRRFKENLNVRPVLYFKPPQILQTHLVSIDSYTSPDIFIF